MTSPANPQTNPASTPTASSTASYASAAGASKKPAATPVIAKGSYPPVVGSAIPSQQHAKTASATSMNGTKPTIMPAVPAVGAPAVAHSNAAINGGADHSRKSSVTISASGPNSYLANGGSVGNNKATMPQFGFQESPAIAHSTPQQASSAPIPIPGNSRVPAVPSPAASPSPIPQPSHSGGPRPPSGLPQDPSTMKFGSLGGDGERHMKHMSSVSQTSIGGSPHFRRDSVNSAQGDGPHGGPVPGRGGFAYQGGRGRGHPGNQPYNNQPMGYPPNNQFPRGPGGQGRGMPSQFHPRGGMQYSNNSPRMAQASPAIPHAMPTSGTPQMQAAVPIPGAQFQYPPPMPGYNNHQNYPYHPPPFNPQQGPMMPYGAYQPMPFMNPPTQSPSPSFQQPFGAAQYAPPGAQPMSRNSSQNIDRPGSSTSQISQQPPAVVQGNNAPPVVGSANKAPAVVSSSFVKPRKSAAIVIKKPDGTTLDTQNLDKTEKPPASPVPSIQQSKTPPVVTSTPTPPPVATSQTHARTESVNASKTADQVRNEFRERVRLTAAPDAKSTDDEAEKPATDAAQKDTATSKPAEDAKPSIEPKATETDKAAASSETEKPKAEEPALSEEDELERQIREMEEADARREKEAEEFAAKRKIEMEAKKKRDDEQRLKDAAENDAKLREQEREMERIEEERERKRNAGGKSESVADLLAKKISDLTISSKTESGATTPDALANSMSDLKITGSGTSSPALGETGAAKTGAADKQAKKPAALNLAPLNTKAVEPPQPSAQLTSLRTARFLQVIETDMYPPGIQSPNPALNSAVTKKGKSFKYDPAFLLQFQQVFTEKPTLDFDQQVKSLLGDGEGNRQSASARTPGGLGGSGRQNSRPSATGGFPSMGQFGAGAKTLPPGTTSDQRFMMSTGQLPRPNAPGIGSFGRPGSAFGGNQLSRQPSSSNMVPNSPRQGSRSTRGGSKRGDFGAAKNEAQAAKTMPLTAGMEIKPIAVSASGWKPTSIGRQSAAAANSSGMLEPDMVQRKVKAALNKMTPENFDKISKQILDIAMQSKHEEDGRTLRQVIQLTFEKATDEAHWASMYAKFCKRMLEEMSPEIRDSTILDKSGNVVTGGALFRKYLLNRCQEDFERGWATDLPSDNSKEAALLTDEYYEAAGIKRRGLGLVGFIGELFKLGMLTERIMHECVRKLVDSPNLTQIESLSKLLRTIGANLDATEKGRGMMDAYFQRISTITNSSDLDSRYKFMLMDVVDLRRAGWVTKEGDKGPKTLEEVRQEAEAAAAAKAAEAARSNQRGGTGGRPPVGRGDARGMSYNQPVPNQVGMDDLRRLKGSAGRTASSNVTLGPTSMFQSRSNSGRAGLRPGGALSRGGDDSSPASRTGTPPTTTSRSNAFDVLANMETENPASPPSTAASPAMSKAALSSDKKESD